MPNKKCLQYLTPEKQLDIQFLIYSRCMSGGKKSQQQQMHLDMHLAEKTSCMWLISLNLLIVFQTLAWSLQQKDESNAKFPRTSFGGLVTQFPAILSLVPSNINTHTYTHMHTSLITQLQKGTAIALAEEDLHYHPKRQQQDPRGHTFYRAHRQELWMLNGSTFKGVFPSPASPDFEVENQGGKENETSLRSQVKCLSVMSL